MRIIMVACIIAVAVTGADAMTVAGVGKGGFADFSKAIVFTGSACPPGAETIQTNSGVKNCAVPMKPVGDGSWICTVGIYPGANYKYYFEYRIPMYDSTTVYTDSQKTYAWRNVAATGTRNQDVERDITVPAAVQEGYVFYHIYGDKDVRGKQGMGKQGTAWDTEMMVVNPDVARYAGTVDVDNTGDGDTANLGGNNNYSMAALQTSDTVIRLSWYYSYGGDGFAPTLEGAREFDTQSAYTPYGCRILRARLTSLSATVSPITNLKFEDSVVWQVTGDTLWSPSRSWMGTSWYNDAATFVDTSLPTNTAVGDSYVYVVLWQDAYGNSNDTGDENFSGGYSTFFRGNHLEAMFMVEQFDPRVVFPSGGGQGRVRLTPYIHGVPDPWRSFWAQALLVKVGG